MFPVFFMYFKEPEGSFFMGAFVTEKTKRRAFAAPVRCMRKKLFINFKKAIDKQYEMWYYLSVITVLSDIVHSLQKGAAYVFYRPDKQNTHL